MPVYFYSHKNGISFRKLNRDDLPYLRDLKNESWFGTVNTVCVNDDDQENWYKKISSENNSMYFVATSNDVSIGLFGLTNIHHVNRSCEFTHSIYSCHRGKGLGKLSLKAGIDMAFEMFNMRRIETWILSNNFAEISSVAKIGFVEEGEKKEAVYKCGKYLDCKLFGLLRADLRDTDLENRWNPYKENADGICNISYLPKNGILRS